MPRWIEIAVSLTALAVFGPVGLVIAAILRFTGEGEVFYVQQRVGQSGRPFGLIKFATMLKDSPNMEMGTVTLRDDPRVLPLGKILRKTKLNEVPQLINVLKGDMGLVGPRPLTSETFAYYSPELRRRLARVRPGLTGIGSIVFRDEEGIVARSDKPPHDCYVQEIAPYKGALELWYIERRCAGLDFKLLLLTVVALLSPNSSAYRKWLADLPASSLPGLV